MLPFPHKLKKPIIIAGPCSAESESQIHSIFSALKSLRKVDCVRAGVWKPRTRPGNFEGVGDEALQWLMEAQKEYNLPYCTEIADPRQLDIALKYNVSMIWIGARTTANPFSVQSLADALKGIEIPVYIKNPTNPDLELWIGAVERIGKSVENIGLIHRGFTIYGSKQFRNPPMYELAIEMKRIYKHIPFLMDPSHIGGKPQLIKPLLTHAVDLDYDGMMVEVHNNPQVALSDKNQQITPEDFSLIINSLIWKSNLSLGVDQQSVLNEFRIKIDDIDASLLDLLSQRMNIAAEIGAYKNQEKITILQTDRLDQVRAHIMTLGQKLGLGSDFLKQYISALHLESINHQQKDQLF